MFNEVDEISVSESFFCTPTVCGESVLNPSKHLKVLTQNIRSVHKNFDMFCVMLSTLKFDCDIIVLTECWLTTNKSVPQLPNYKITSSSQTFNQNDGLVVYCKNSISCKTEEPHFSGANCIIIKIGDHTAIVAIYRPPSFRSIELFLHSLENSLLELKGFKNIIVIGDVNIDIKTNSSDTRSIDYLNLTAEHGFLPAHTLATRDGNCIDHVLLKSKAPALTFVLDTVLTDHFPVLICLSSTPLNIKFASSLKRTDYHKSIAFLKNCDLSSILKMTDANHAANLFVNILSNALQRFTIYKTLPCRQRISKPWITQGLLRCIRHRDNMHRKVKKRPNDDILIKSYRRYRNFCNYLLKKLKLEYERSEIQKASKNSKQTWKVIKKISNTVKTKTPPVDLLKTDPNPQTAVNSVNSFFANLGMRLADTISNNMNSLNTNTNIQSSVHPRSFVLLNTDEEEVERLILNLKNDCATGWDGISSSFLKHAKDIIIPSLTHIINLCFCSGIFPKPFKISIIHPIHKNGTRDDVNNYRPISILPALSKIIEKLINKRLMNFLEQEGLLSESQYGFRANKSTEQAVSNLTNFIISNLDKKKKCVGIFLDMAKAFDTVSMPLLLQKLERVGIRGTPLELFRDYLTNRSQRVKIDDMISDEETVTYGVPQGSILGPSLFLIFINDLCCFNPNHGRIFTFADDTALLFEGDTWEQARSYAEQGLRDVISWLQINLLTLNFNKSKFIYFSIIKRNISSVQNMKIQAHSCKDAPDKDCGCVFLEQVNSIKYLGVIIDEQLTWMPHIESVSSRVRKLIWVFKNLRHVTSSELLKSIYYAICQSIVGYCISVWGGACKTKLLNLERSQRSVLKVMSFKPFRYPTDLLYAECKILSVRQLFILYVVLSHHKNMYFDSHTSTSSRSTKNICLTQLCSTTFARRQPYFMGAYIYNKIHKIFNIYPMTRYACKKTLTEWLLNQDYLSTESILVIQS